MSTVKIKGLLEFNHDVVGLRVLTEEHQRLFDIDKDILVDKAQGQLTHSTYLRIPLIAVGDKLVCEEEHGRGETLPLIDTRNAIVEEVERILLGVQKSVPQPLIKNDKPTNQKQPQKFMLGIESKEYDPLKKDFVPKQFEGDFTTTSKEEAAREAKEFYAAALDTVAEEITVLYVDTVEEYKQRQAAKSQAQNSQLTLPVESNKSQEPATIPQPSPKDVKPNVPVNPKSSAKIEKPKADKPEPKKKTKQYTVLLSVKSLTPDGLTVEDREIKRDFEDVNVTNAKMKARETLAKEYNVPMKDVKVLKAGVKK